MQNSMCQETIEKLISATKEAESYFGVKLYTDEVFSDVLNNYFHYNYNNEKDILEVNLELDKGEAFLIIENALTAPHYVLSAGLESEVLISYDDTYSY